MLILLQAANEPWWQTALLVVIFLVFAGGLLYIGGFILLWIGLFIRYAFSNITRLTWHFLAVWALLSGSVWLFEGDRVTYGWAAAIAMGVSVVTAAIVTLEQEH